MGHGGCSSSLRGGGLGGSVEWVSEAWRTYLARLSHHVLAGRHVPQHHLEPVALELACSVRHPPIPKHGFGEWVALCTVYRLSLDIKTFVSRCAGARTHLEAVSHVAESADQEALAHTVPHL